MFVIIERSSEKTGMKANKIEYFSIFVIDIILFNNHIFFFFYLGFVSG